MRKIKYRAYNKHSEKMFSWKKIKKEARHITKEKDILCLPLFKHIKYMQYTGLKDKNGKEIYEGDIVTVDSRVIQRYYNFVVIDYCRGGFVCKSPDFEDWEYHQIGNFVEGIIEVIGNIYENPELLEANNG